MPKYTIDYNHRNSTGKMVRGYINRYYTDARAAKKDTSAMNRLDPSAKAVVRDRRRKLL